MKARIAFLIGSAALSGLLASCGGSNYHAPMMMPMPMPMPMPMTKNLDTAAVLTIIQTMTSETAAPFEVDNAAVAVTPIGDETSAPLSVDAT